MLPPYGVAREVGLQMGYKVATATLILVGMVAGGWGPSARAQDVPAPDSVSADSATADTSAVGLDREAHEVNFLGPLQAPATDSLASMANVALDGQSDNESTARIDTGLVRRYLPARSDRSLSLFDQASPFLGPRTGATERSIRLDTARVDSAQRGYLIDDTDRFGGPLRVSEQVYRRERYRSNLQDNWRTLTEQRQQQQQSRGGLGVNMVVPGGRQSAFSTVFGKPQVDLRLNGQADINAGFKYRKSDQQVNITGDASQLNPSFKQDLRLGITGTIGDKLQINVDWDTKSQFNYQNQVKLDYTGYEDEILQNVEAGNVSMQTPSQLISGGQSLFGIKSEFQLGNLNLTTIASQQEGQSNTLNIEGGAQESEFDLTPTDYDENRHYFLG